MLDIMIIFAYLIVVAVGLYLIGEIKSKDKIKDKEIEKIIKSVKRRGENK